ncbi:hypothetical protein D3C79_761980 [compost metagenome]
MAQPQLPALAIEQHQLGAHASQQVTVAIPVGKQRMGERADEEAGPDLLGVRSKLQPVVTKEGIDRRYADFEQGEEHQVELGNVWQLHQGGVADAKAVAGQPLGQPGRTFIELAIADAALSAEDGDRIRRHLALAGQHGGQRLAAPVTLGAIPLGQILGPAAVGLEGIGPSHSATSVPRPRAFNMVPSLVPVSAHSMAGSEPATMPAPANNST